MSVYKLNHLRAFLLSFKRGPGQPDLVFGNSVHSREVGIQ